MTNRKPLYLDTASGNFEVLASPDTVDPTVSQVASVAGKTGTVTLVESDVASLVSDLAAKAPLASPTFTGTVTVPTPVNGTDASTKAYADGLANGLSIKSSCRVGTTAALPTNTYLLGVLTAAANGALTVDGVAVATNDRVLVKDEAAGANNGIYVVTATGDSTHPYVLTRSSDMNTAAEVPGAFTFVEAGTANAATGWVVASSGPFTLGTTVITWTKFSSAGSSSYTDPLTTKGDLVGRSSSATVRVAVGTDGTSLVADSTQTAGFKWGLDSIALLSARATLI